MDQRYDPNEPTWAPPTATPLGGSQPPASGPWAMPAAPPAPTAPVPAYAAAVAAPTAPSTAVSPYASAPPTAPTAPTPAYGGGQPPYGNGQPPTMWAPPPQYPPPGSFGSPTGGQQPHRTGTNVTAVVAFFTLVALVFGLTAGVLIDRTFSRSDETQTRLNSPAISTPNTDSGSGSGSGSGSANSGGTSGNSQGLVPGQNGTDNGSSSTDTSGLSDTEASAIAAKVTDGLVNINTELSYQNAAAAGTGMILTSDGKVLTNNHVIDGATTIKVTVIGTGKTYTARVIGTAPESDVALLQILDASDLPTIPIDSSGNVEVGDKVVAAGNAGGKNGDPIVVSGAVTALNQTITASDESGSNSETLHNLIETSAPIQSGDSGGPLISTDGKVIGMNTAASANNQYQSANSVGYAIPIADALKIVKRIESGEESDEITQGYPGIMGVSVAAQSAQVQAVADNSPAAKAGISAGDTLQSVNGQKVSSGTEVTNAMKGKKAGDRITVTWLDSSGQTRSATVTLIEGPAN